MYKKEDGLYIMQKKAPSMLERATDLLISLKSKVTDKYEEDAENDQLRPKLKTKETSPTEEEGSSEQIEEITSSHKKQTRRFIRNLFISLGGSV